MTFVPLYNFKQMCRAGANVGSTLTFKNTSGSDQTLVKSYSWSYAGVVNAAPFAVNSGGTKTSLSYEYLLVTASGDDEIPFSTYSVPNPIGTASINYALNSKGWAATITISGTEGSTIKSLFFRRGLCYNSSMNVGEAVIFALVLDNPVTIDSTGTANFTFAIEF